MLTTVIAFCLLTNPHGFSTRGDQPFLLALPPAIQGYQPIIKTGGVESSPSSMTGGPELKRATWYTQTTQRVEVRLGGDPPAFPLEVTLKFETPSQVLGVDTKDIVRKVIFTKPNEVVKLNYSTTSTVDSLTFSAYVADKKVASLIVGIYRPVVGAGVGGS